MFKTIFIAGLMLLPAQQFQIPGRTWQGAASSCPFTDSFSASSGTALNSSNWTNVSALSTGGGTIVQNSGVAQGSSAFKAGGAIVTGGSCTISANHYAQVTSVQANASNIYVYVRMNSSGNGYALTGSGNLDKVTGGSYSFLSSGCGAVSAGTVMRLTVSGSSNAVLTASYNGTTCISYTDSSSPYLSGSPGFYIGNGSPATATQASTFSAD